MKASNKKNSLVYSVEEAGALLGIGRNSAYAAAATGEIPTIRIGKRVVVPKAAFDRMVADAQASEQPPAVLIKKMPRKPKLQINIRVSVELNNKLVDAAVQKGVSLAEEVVARLTSTFDEAPK